MYRLSKMTGIPYATIHDICTGSARLEKCSAETVYKVAQALDVTMESLLGPVTETRNNFELFKSNVCHRVKELGDIDFIAETLQRDDIRTYYNRRWYRESYYLLAMLDYISRLNDIPRCTAYDDLRGGKLSETVYPSGVLIMCAAAHNDAAKEMALREAIPEFLRFNIVESGVRDVA